MKEGGSGNKRQKNNSSLQFFRWILLTEINSRVSFCVSFCRKLWAYSAVKFDSEMALKAASVLDRCLEILCVILCVICVSKKEGESAKKR